MAEPLSTGLSILRVGELLKKGFDHFTKEFPQYPAFWKPFSQRLQGDPNIPWDQIKDSEYKLEFIGIAMALMAGVDDAQQRLASYFEFIEAREGPYEDRETVLKRILITAEEVANEVAPAEMRELIQRRLLAEEIHQAKDEIKEDLKESTADVRSDIADLAKGLDKVKEAQGEQSKALSRAQVEAILYQQGRLGPLTGKSGQASDRIREIAEGMLEGLEAETGEPTGEVDQLHIITQVRAGGDAEIREALDRRFPEATEAEASSSQGPVDLVSYAGGGESPEELLDRLADEDQDAASELRGVFERDGVEGVAELIESQSGPQTGPSLVTAARIVGKAGRFIEAETAYLRAADLSADDHTKARQLVRASAMAEVQQAPERAAEHLAAAKEIAPEHPGLLITEARASGDPEFILAHLADVEPESDVERALLHVARTQAHLFREDEEAARAELELALQASPDNPAVREFQAILPWHFAKLALSQSRIPDLNALHQAGDRFLELYEEIASEARRNEAAHLAARAAESYALSEDLDRAIAVLDRVENPSELSLDARLALADAMIVTRRPDRVRDLLTPEDESEEAQLLLGDSVMFGSGTAEERTEAAERLEALLDSDDEILVARAAFALLVGASTELDVEWNERAAEVLKSQKPIAEATMKAERLRLEGDLDAAEAVLLPFASEHLALRQLRDYAVERDSWEAVRDRSRELIRKTGDPRDRLMFARSLSQLGAGEDASAEFLSVARDGTLSDEIRSGGFLGAIEIAAEGFDYGAVLSIAEEWHRDLPEDTDALWNLLFALARLSRHSEAYELSGAESVTADNPRRAALLAEILHRAAPRVEALTRIAELSDQFDRAEEALEGIFFLTAMNAEQEGVEIPNDLADRIRETIATFPERFPDSQVIRSVEMPSSREGIRELFEELAGGEGRIRQQQELLEQIKNGQMPVNSFAAVGPGGIAEAWLRLSVWPLGFAMERQDAADLEAARTSLGSAAVWDSSSIFITSELGEARSSTIRGAFPGSLIANETLEDADAGTTLLPGRGAGESVHGPETGEIAGFREKSDEEREREQQVAEAMLGGAKEFAVEPGFTDSSDEQLRELYEEAAPRAWKALLATIALAERTGLPIYSDDRWIREFARSRGLGAFGSLAVIEVLTERNVVSPEESMADRRRLAVGGTWGLQMTGEELVAAGRESEWKLDQALIGGLTDRAAWRAAPGHQLRAGLALLQAVHKEAPDQFSRWLHRILSAAQLAVPEMPKSWSTESLLLIGFGLGDDDGEELISGPSFKHLIFEVNHLPGYLRDLGQDPVLGAAATLVNGFAGEDRPLKAAALTFVLHRLPTLEAVRIFDAFVKH